MVFFISESPRRFDKVAGVRIASKFAASAANCGQNKISSKFSRQRANMDNAAPLLRARHWYLAGR
jgi:hypothetical protein